MQFFKLLLSHGSDLLQIKIRPPCSNSCLSKQEKVRRFPKMLFQSRVGRFLLLIGPFFLFISVAQISLDYLSLGSAPFLFWKHLKHIDSIWFLYTDRESKNSGDEERQHILDGCRHVYLDMGTNSGVTIISDIHDDLVDDAFGINITISGPNTQAVSATTFPKRLSAANIWQILWANWREVFSSIICSSLIFSSGTWRPSAQLALNQISCTMRRCTS